MDDQAPRVFLSYSDDSPQHAARVLELAQWLRSNGVDAQIDQFEDSPEEGWPRWVYRQIRESDFVLVVCTVEYLVRCEGEAPRSGGGDKSVKFESHLSLQEIHDAEGRNRKFVPVLFDEDDVGECVPLPLRSATFYRLPHQRDDLYRRLSDQPKVRPAPLGALRTLDDDSFESSASGPAASESIESLIAAAPAKKSARSMAARRLVIVGAFGVGILGTALLLGSNIGGKHVGGGTKKCSIQLVDSDGETIDNPNGVSLVLPAGQEIDVTVEGNTLHFECPKVAVNARVRLARADRYEKSATGMTQPENDPIPTAAADQKDDADMKAAEGVELDGDILISPEPGIQRIRLESSGPKVRYPEYDYQPASVTKEEEKEDEVTRIRGKKKPRGGGG